MNATAAASLRNHYSIENDDTPVDWTLIWARKFRKDLSACGKTGRGYTPVIKRFIAFLNGSPKHTYPLNDFKTDTNKAVLFERNKT